MRDFNNLEFGQYIHKHNVKYENINASIKKQKLYPLYNKMHYKMGKITMTKVPYY